MAGRVAATGRFSFSPSYTPAGAANLAGWYRADAGNVTLASTKVTTWSDTSGNGKHVVQATDASRPTYNATDAGYNNKPTLSFGGAAWLLNIPFVLASGLTYYVAGEATSPGASGCFVDGNTDRALVQTHTSNGVMSMYAGSEITGGPPIVGRAVICCVFNGASSAGHVSSINPTITGNAGSGGLNSLFIGGQSGGLLTGKIAEVILFSAVHSLAQRAQVLNYLSARYAIAVN